MIQGFCAVHIEGRTEQVHDEIVQDKTTDIYKRLLKTHLRIVCFSRIFLKLNSENK